MSAKNKHKKQQARESVPIVVNEMQSEVNEELNDIVSDVLSDVKLTCFISASKANNSTE